MLTVDLALETILNHIKVLDAEDRPLLDSAGQIIAEDVYAGIDIPPHDCSALDGFAVRSEDIRKACPQSPVPLRVIETVPAGFVAGKRVSPGTAVRIMTGAPLPEGADCVVGFENTDEKVRAQNEKKMSPSVIGILLAVKSGANIRRAGEQIARGTLVIRNGTSLGPAETGILASLGCTQARVIRRPRVAVFSTGEELVEAGTPLPGHRIYNGNSFNIAAQVLRCGGVPRITGISRDNKRSIAAGVRRSLNADMIVSTGGVSAGDHDLVRDVLNEMGEIVFWKVNMTPGKSCAFALVRRSLPGGGIVLIPHFALNGNPPASMISFEVLVRPAILKMKGVSDLMPATVEAISEDYINNPGGSRRFVWVSVEKREDTLLARPASAQVKEILVSISRADGLAVISEQTGEVKPGDKLAVRLLDWH